MTWSRKDLWHYLFFFNDTATTEIYTLSLHDALPIYPQTGWPGGCRPLRLEAHRRSWRRPCRSGHRRPAKSLEIGRATSELQSRQYLVCRLLLEKKKNAKKT